MKRKLTLVAIVLTLAACGPDRLEVTADYAPDLAAPDLSERVLSPRPCDCFGDLAPFQD